MRKRRWRGLPLALLLGALSVGIAQGARITDKLLAGLYPEPDNSAQPTRVLPSDTPLERLEKQGDFTRVRLGDGNEGWVESRFITDEKPARIMLLELQAKNSQLQQQLRDAERQLSAQGEGQAGGGADRNDSELNTLKQQLADARAENTLLKTSPPTDNGAGTDTAALTRQIAELERQLAAAAATPELESLRQANRELEQRLEQIARLAAAGEAAAASESPGRFQAWELPLLLLAMLFSFIGGVAFKNYRLARRYGGLRV